MFDSILPPNLPPQAPQLPPELAAMLPGGSPVTASLAQRLAGMSTPNAAVPAPTPPPAPAPGPIIPPTGTPTAPKPGPTIPGLPLVSPQLAGLSAASDAAAHAPVFNSPLATLASSVLEGIRGGTSAFAAQRQSNKEAAYKQAVVAADEKSYKDYINNDANFASFGSQGAGLQAALKGMSPEAGQKLLQNSDLWKPSTIAFGKGGLYDERSKTIVRQPDGEAVPEGAAIPALDPVTQQQLTNPDGSPKFIIPSPKPTASVFDKTDPEFKAAALGLFSAANDPNWKPSTDQAAAVNAAILANKLKVAHAGVQPIANQFESALTKKEVDDMSTRSTDVQGKIQVLPNLYRAQALLASGDVNTGITEPLAQFTARMLGKHSAEDTQRYSAEVLSTLFGAIKAQGGSTSRFSQKELDIMAAASGGGLQNQLGALKTIIANRIEDAKASGDDNNARVGGLARKYPQFAGELMSQYGTPVPQDPSTTTGTKNADGVMVRTVNGVEQHQSPSTGKWMSQDKNGQWISVPDKQP